MQMRNINIDWHSYVGTYGIGVYFFLKVSPVQRPYKDDIKLYLYCDKERELPE